MASVKPPTLDREAHGLWLTTGEWDALYKTARTFGFSEASAFVRYCIWIVKQLEGAEAVKEAATAAAKDFRALEEAYLSALAPKEAR